MPFAFYQRLSAARKRTYRESDGVHEIRLPPGSPLAPVAGRLQRALAGERRAEVQSACQDLVDEIVSRLQVPPLTVKVYAVRPRLRDAELHGLYQPEEDGRRAKISIWMRTVQRKQVVAFRTFLRTLVHEVCHHLDYEWLRLPETFHTEGFYKRESSLMHQILELPRP